MSVESLSFSWLRNRLFLKNGLFSSLPFAVRFVHLIPSLINYMSLITLITLRLLNRTQLNNFNVFSALFIALTISTPFSFHFSKRFLDLFFYLYLSVFSQACEILWLIIETNGCFGVLVESSCWYDFEFYSFPTKKNKYFCNFSPFCLLVT